MVVALIANAPTSAGTAGRAVRPTLILPTVGACWAQPARPGAKPSVTRPRLANPTRPAAGINTDYADFLELIGKADMAQRIRASSLSKWAELEPKAMAWLADQLAAKRPRPTQREKAQEQPSARSAPPAPTGDPIIDGIRKRSGWITACHRRQLPRPIRRATNALATEPRLSAFARGEMLSMAVAASHDNDLTPLPLLMAHSSVPADHVSVSTERIAPNFARPLAFQATAPSTGMA